MHASRSLARRAHHGPLRGHHRAAAAARALPAHRRPGSVADLGRGPARAAKAKLGLLAVQGALAASPLPLGLRHGLRRPPCRRRGGAPRWPGPCGRRLRRLWRAHRGLFPVAAADLGQRKPLHVLDVLGLHGRDRAPGIFLHRRHTVHRGRTPLQLQLLPRRLQCRWGCGFDVGGGALPGHAGLDIPGRLPCDYVHPDLRVCVRLDDRLPLERGTRHLGCCRLPLRGRRLPKHGVHDGHHADGDAHSEAMPPRRGGHGLRHFGGLPELRRLRRVHNRCAAQHLLQGRSLGPGPMQLRGPGEPADPGARDIAAPLPAVHLFLGAVIADE
mmetsp:Transcript_54910/g.157902  ORF Transcript_54910/g.157902 Transcript_54910/m.157902 type:complete len:328 (+) Transcript_54910:624-1607(+)